MKNLGIILTGIIAWFIAERRREWRRKAEKFADLSKPQRELAGDLEKNLLITQKLAELRALCDADKAKIFRFHNGGTYSDTTSIIKFSMTNLITKDGVAGPKPGILKDLKASLFPNMLKMLTGEYKVFSWSAADAPDAYLRMLHTSEGARRVTCVCLRDFKCEVVGFLSLNWLDDEGPTATCTNTHVLRFAEEIGHLVSENKK